MTYQEGYALEKQAVNRGQYLTIPDHISCDRLLQLPVSAGNQRRRDSIAAAPLIDLDA
jgi:hypothetical protein